MPKTVSPMKPTSCCNWVEGGVSHGLCPGTTSRGSPTLAGCVVKPLGSGTLHGKVRARLSDNEEKCTDPLFQ